MSITAETAKQHANDPAVLCCRAEEGTVLEPANFEDPAIFPDLIDSGLLNTDGALKLCQVLNGSKLTKTVDSLTPITPDIVDKYDAAEEEAAEEEAPAEEAAAEAAAPVAAAQDDSEIIAVIAAAVAACGVSADQIACVRRIDAKSAWTVSSRVEAISVRKECF